jgi:hypothetical protein
MEKILNAGTVQAHHQVVTADQQRQLGHAKTQYRAGRLDIEGKAVMRRSEGAERA